MNRFFTKQAMWTAMLVFVLMGLCAILQGKNFGEFGPAIAGFAIVIPVVLHVLEQLAPIGPITRGRWMTMGAAFFAVCFFGVAYNEIGSPFRVQWMIGSAGALLVFALLTQSHKLAEAMKMPFSKIQLGAFYGASLAALVLMWRAHLASADRWYLFALAMTAAIFQSWFGVYLDERMPKAELHEIKRTA